MEARYRGTTKANAGGADTYRETPLPPRRCSSFLCYPSTCKGSRRTRCRRCAPAVRTSSRPVRWRIAAAKSRFVAGREGKRWVWKDGGRTGRGVVTQENNLKPRHRSSNDGPRAVGQTMIEALTLEKAATSALQERGLAPCMHLGQTEKIKRERTDGSRRGSRV